MSYGNWGAQNNPAFRTGTTPFNNTGAGFNTAPAPTFSSFTPQPAQPFGGNNFTGAGFGTNPAPAQSWGSTTNGFNNPNPNSYTPGGLNPSFQNNNSAVGNPFTAPGYGAGFMQGNPSMANQSIPNNPQPFGTNSFAPAANPTFNQNPAFSTNFNPSLGFNTSTFTNPNPNPTSTFNQGSFSTTASAFTGSNPNPAPGGLFNTGTSFTGLNMGMNTNFAGQTAIKYKPTSIREETSNINILHICALNEMNGKSIEEQRLQEYKQRPTQVNPQNSLTNSAPSLVGTSMPSLNSNPFNSTGLSNNSSLFNKPPDNKPGPSLFSMQPSQPSSLFSVPTSTSSLFNPTPTSSAFTMNSAPNLAPNNNSNLFSNTNPSSFFSGQAQNTGASLFTGTQLANNNLFQPKPATPSFSQPQGPDTISSAYRDPHGLNWLFPEIIPESIIKSYKERYAAQISSDPISVVERIFKPKRVNNYPQVLTEKWKSTQEKKSLKSSSGFDLLNNKKTEPFFINKRTNFLNLKLEQYKDEDGGKYFKCPGGTPKRTENIMEICVKAHDPEPIKLLIQVTPEKTIREIKLEVSRHLPDIHENSIQLIYKSKILSPFDTVSSLGICHNDELNVINAPLIHNTLAEFPTPDMFPRIPENYRMWPSIIEMARMNVNELKAVENFTIENQFGKIRFEGLTNVLGLDIGRIIEIKDKEIIGYPEESGADKPEVGKELNKPCEVTLYKFFVGGTRDKVEQKLRTMCQRWNMEYKSYDYQTAELLVRIRHF